MAEVPEQLRSALRGRYDLQRELGRGGMASVYLARDLRYDRSVAIKVLSEPLAASVGRARFLLEIQFAARLNHPHILPLLDSGEAGDLLYYVMPYVEGESLKDRIEREKQLPIREAIAIARDVAAGLGHAHSQGIVHRDVKPGNILPSGGSAVIADFGIARAVRRSATDDTLTDVNLAIGTPAYMSPEQWSGTRELDARSDIYALGCVVYEMLAGQPPFTGSTTEAIAARVAFDPVPPIRTVRPKVSAALERVILRALEKVPADRYATAAEFADALATPPLTSDDDGGPTPVPGSPDRHRSEVTPRKGLAVMALLILVVVASGLAWRFVAERSVRLDTNRIVVFPLTESEASTGREWSGEEVALMIGSGLEHTEPLKWIDGWTLLDPGQRADLTLLTSADARRLARSRGARWYIDGSVVRRGDSATVVLRLNDVVGDSVAGRSTTTRRVLETAQAGLQAVNELLPRLLTPGDRIDLTPLAARRPAAVASWLQGEREYRRSDFAAALGYLRRAVGEDSALAVAALRGAQAASWGGQLEEAADLIRVALAHVRLLPTRNARFARGLAAYLAGQADSSLYWLHLALAGSPEWTEAHMALGEVYYHLLPSVAAPLDSLAEAEFRAAAADTGFAPALFHLAQIAMRGGNVELAERAVRRFERFNSGREQKTQVSLMLACARGGGNAVNWGDVARDSPIVALTIGQMVAVAGTSPGCAEDAFRTVLTIRTAGDLHWGAFLALQGVLAAQGRGTAIDSLVDSLTAAGLWRAANAYLIDALAGVPGFASKVDETIAALQRAYGPPYEDSLRAPLLLLIGTWYARSSRFIDAARLHQALGTRAAATNDPETRLYADALAAHLLLAHGDSAAALRSLEHLVPQARRDFLMWGYSEALPVERFTRAELLLSRHRYQEALTVASAFDHPTPIAYLPFLPASLVLRYQAAEALARPKEAEIYRRRLTALGRADLLAARN